jgi:defect in organelle trafficking protein DotB
MAIETGQLPNEPVRFTADHLDTLLHHCYQLAVSDITFQTNEQVWAESEGRLLPITQRKLSHHEIVELLHRIYGPNGNAQILSGKDINTHYECRVNRRTRYRFRINGTGCWVDGHEGIQLSFRAIATTPPLLETLALEPELFNALAPHQGIVYITGPTGSGKSTLLASIIRNIAEKTDSHRKILTYESPIEFIYDELNKPHAIISQSEIPRHLPSFAAGVKNALRRNPKLILIGEAPDPDTIKAVIVAGLTGHPVYTTLHSSGVAETMRRLISALRTEENISPIIDILETVRVIVWQTLVPTVEGKRTALREFLVFDESIRNTLLETPLHRLTTVTRRLLHQYGQPMAVDAQRKFQAGLISERDCHRFSKRSEELFSIDD